MMSRMFSKGTVLAALIVSWLIMTSRVDGAKKPVTIAVFPCIDVVMVFDKFHPLVTYLEQETGLGIRLVVPTDLAEFEKLIRNGDIDFAFQDAQTYVRFAGLYDKETVLRALTHEGRTTQCGVVIVKKTSGISSVADLKGKSVMFGPEFSSVRWVMAKLLFEENGLDMEKDLTSYSHGQRCQDIAFNVQFDAVDAGVVCDHFLEGRSEKQHELGVDPETLVVIGRTKLVPMRVFSARRDLGSDIVSKVNQALLGLNTKVAGHEKILCRAELGGFQKSKDADYDDVRRQLGIKAEE
jgi:phosphonate transport system substrate-binding protein